MSVALPNAHRSTILRVARDVIVAMTPTLFHRLGHAATALAEMIMAADKVEAAVVNSLSLARLGPHQQTLTMAGSIRTSFHHVRKTQDMVA